jgi:lipopolysaccharide export system permease protein
MLQSFVPLFVMTFLICLFIVLMQFLWRYIDDLVGKGIGIEVIAELFLYAALTMVPMALPLAILLASLMTFGNLGERFELTATKASGISLIRTMRPLIILMVFVAIGAFFFQNNVLPIAQTKMWTLLYSVKQKSPELEIPEGVFYDQIPGYNLFVKEKNRDTGVLRDVMIYDVSRGFDNARVILSDSATLSITSDKTHLYLRLFSGEQFENLRESTSSMSQRDMPYRQESFSQKNIVIPFDANFNRMDESGMRNQYVGKNIAELQATIDSVHARIDSIGDIYASSIKEVPYFRLQYNEVIREGSQRIEVRSRPVQLTTPIDIDSVFEGPSTSFKKSYINQALAKARRMRQDFEYKSYSMQDDEMTLRRHGIELMKKFTLSLACIIFFFIGAPLGAIIRKGGLGMPLVISVFLFIFYYIIDNTGIKLARDGRLEVWEGMWLSSAVLLPLGIFFTSKAVNDSAVFNRDAYVNFFRRILGLRETRHIDMKEVIIDEVELSIANEKLQLLADRCRQFVDFYAKRQSYFAYWLHGYSRSEIHGLSADTNNVVEYLSNSRSRKVIARLSDIPVIRSLWLYHPTNYRPIGWVIIVLFPLGIVGYIMGQRAQRRLKVDINRVASLCKELLELLPTATDDNHID